MGGHEGSGGRGGNGLGGGSCGSGGRGGSGHVGGGSGSGGRGRKKYGRGSEQYIDSCWKAA